jgi:serine/threonine-protein kinase
VRVALKIPFSHLVSKEVLEDFRREIRMAAKLDHPNIMPLKSADLIDDKLVIAFPLGWKTLDSRLQHRMSVATAIDLIEQVLSAVAYAHENLIVHCDIKPDNLVMLEDGRLMLTDFGIAKVADKTIRGAGTGTIGFLAPEQALGKPSTRSDVFSIGLILYRMLSGVVPEWPFEWPPPDHERIRRRVAPELMEIVRKSLELNPKSRYADAGQMLAALRKIKKRALQFAGKTTQNASVKQTRSRDWRTTQRKQFIKQFGKQLETVHHCHRCDGPIAEAMKACPWCGTHRKIHRDPPRFNRCCPRCHRGMKADWEYCAYCFGPGFDDVSNRAYTDKRYNANCRNVNCDRKQLMPFMQYCPWCRRKVKQKWRIEGSEERCDSCGWGIAGQYWNFCPWCTKAIPKKRNK